MSLLYKVLVLLALSLAATARAEDLNQFSLLSQNDWSGKKGIFLVLDNRYTGQPSTLSNLRVTFAVADGKQWHIRSASHNFQFGQTYRIRAQVDGTNATLFLNDAQALQFPAAYLSHPAPLFAFDNSDWARRPAEYLIIQKSLSIQTAGKTHLLEAPASIDPKRYLFNPGTGQWRENLTLAAPFTIDAVFEVQPAPDLQKLSPLIDPYGQINFASWPGKITSDQQLRQALADEDARLAEWEKTLPPQDKFGGRTDLGWKETPTGHFRTLLRDGKWWLISPEGNPTFFTGICGVPATTWEGTPISRREFLFDSLPPRDGAHAFAWGADYWGDSNTQYLAPQAPNLIRLYGNDWRDRETARALRRVRAWGFSGMGKWTNLPQQTRLPLLNRDGVPNLINHPDTFDPAIRAQFRDTLARQIASQEKDPWIIGFSLGNEAAESFSPDEVRRILSTQDGASHAKRAMIDYAVNKLFSTDARALAAAWGGAGESAEQLSHQRLKPRDQDIEPLRAFVAEHYFGFVYRTVKELAPNHLYFGHWILPTYWNNENDWRHIAPYCDVIGFDLYEYSFDDPRLQPLVRETNKPIFCGEFGFPSYWDGQRGFGRFRTATADEAESGQRYAEWVRAAAGNRWCIGVSVFQYRDQPVTGRGPVREAQPAAVHGENYAFGMVDVTNQPKWPLLEQVRAANLAAPSQRMHRATP